MRSNAAVVIALQLPLLSAGISHGHGHKHADAHRHALATEVVVVTETVYTTLTIEPSSTPSNAPPSSTSAALPPDFPSISATALPAKVVSSVVSSVVPPVASPSATTPANNNGPYQALIPEAYSAIMKNSCDYHVFVTSAGNPTCGEGKTCVLVAPNTTYSEKIRICKEGSISLKVSKTENMAKPMQFEYGVWTDKKTVSYDISYLDCMENTEGEQDLSACAGHDGGIQAVAGADCPTYHCVANEWCPTQAYVVAEFDYQPGAPVGACGIDKGVAFELCAKNRS
jgi:hypothetical protein